MSADNNDKTIKKIFENACEREISAPPFMKTRILSNIAQVENKSSYHLFWKSLALTSSFLMIIAFIYIMNFSSTTFDAIAMKPVAIKIELEILNDNTIFMAEIELPEDVNFYSTKHAKVSKLRKLRINSKTLLNLKKLPIVVKAQNVGYREILVNFYNKSNELVSKKTIKINFSSGGTL